MSGPARGRAIAGACFLITAIFWLGSVGYLVATGTSAARPLIALIAFGFALPSITWFLSRQSRPPVTAVARPMRELACVLGYLVLYAFYYLGWATGAVAAMTHPGPEQDIAMLILNLGVSVSGPAVLLFLLGADVAPLFDAGIRRKGFWPILLIVGPALVAVVGLAATNPKVAAVFSLPLPVLAWAAPGAFLLIALPAGLCEEFLFRAVLQSRLAAVLRSEVAAAILSALLFAMSHVPGTFLHGVPGVPGYSVDLVHVVAYAMAVMAPLGFLCAVVWWRTRSLLLVTLIHACAAVLPTIAGFAASWS